METFQFQVVFCSSGIGAVGFGVHCEVYGLPASGCVKAKYHRVQKQKKKDQNRGCSLGKS